MAEQLTRQQIYDRIRSGSKDSYVLKEMQRLGFWDTDQPAVPEQLIQKETKLNKELAELSQIDRKYQNREAMIAEMRKDRMKKAKARREETKQTSKKKKLDKVSKWKLTQEKQILYLGKGVSAGLNNMDSDVDTLKKYNLPIFSDVVELAKGMGITLADMRYLLYHRQVAKTSHYYTFSIPKKSGGLRTISSPKRKLKDLQHWVLENILNILPHDSNAHGFITGKSICSNAIPHIGKDIVINLDLKNFFPTITYKRIKGMFVKLGYSEQLATIFSLICTEIPSDKVEMDGVEYFVQKSERVLPQGSPASPAISNLIAFRLDKKINGLAKKYNFIYTRYADDLTFSNSTEGEKDIARLLYFSEKIIRSEGLSINTSKTSIMRKGRQQRVTGIVVNEKLNIPRDDMRKFRALLHNIEHNGWNNQKWRGGDKNIYLSVKGYISFVKMVNPARGLQFENQLKRIEEKHSIPTIETKIYSKATLEEKKNEVISEKSTSHVQATKQEEDKTNTNWWNIF